MRTGQTLQSHQSRQRPRSTQPSVGPVWGEGRSVPRPSKATCLRPRSGPVGVCLGGRGRRQQSACHRASPRQNRTRRAPPGTRGCGLGHWKSWCGWPLTPRDASLCGAAFPFCTRGPPVLRPHGAHGSAASPCSRATTSPRSPRTGILRTHVPESALGSFPKCYTTRKYY